MFAGRLAQLKANGHKFNLHLVGHSAGSILLGRLLPELYRWGLKVNTFTLYAPACTLDLFEANIGTLYRRRRLCGPADGVQPARRSRTR